MDSLLIAELFSGIRSMRISPSRKNQGRVLIHPVPSTVFPAVNCSAVITKLFLVVTQTFLGVTGGQGQSFQYFNTSRRCAWLDVKARQCVLSIYSMQTGHILSTVIL